MAEYNDMASDMRDRLNAVSPSMCLAKWLQVSLHLPQGMTQSCYHPPTHSVPLEELAVNPGALHNTKFKIHERKQMLEGKRPEGCSYCWKIEDAEGDHLSDRHYRSSEWWSAPDFETVTGNPPDWDVKPRYVEVNFNQACNFKCMYCSPHLSTSWQEEIERWGGYKLKGLEHNNIAALEQRKMMPLKVASKENPYVQAFWQWWPEVYSNLRVFRMTGGEPLMDANTFKVLDYVYEHPHKNLELSITSNMCPPDQKLFDKFLEKVKRLDSVDYSTECYVADPLDGTDWQTWQNYIIGADMKEYHRSVLPSIERSDIKQTFPEVGQCTETDNNSFTYMYNYKDKAYKHFMLYVSLDGVGAQAEYMRTGMDFNRLLDNVRTFLRETRHTSVSFINTFNIMSIPSLQSFMEMILELRREFGGRAQTTAEGVPMIESDVKPFQRIWFDIPLLRYPPWFSVQNAGAWGINSVENVLKYIEENVQGEDYLETFEGFKPYEILKLKRDLAIMKQPLPVEQQITNKTNFYLFIREYDRRRGTKFTQTFPELAQFYQECLTIATRQ